MEAGGAEVEAKSAVSEEQHALRAAHRHRSQAGQAAQHQGVSRRWLYFLILQAHLSANNGAVRDNGDSEKKFDVYVDVKKI